ncbi:acetyl esterase/lipase [Variovorax boronicumulans]|uniref:alpha/beta hydrolase n=1 Tax=Variovorax boronicumulans TaxID=436515 RepID=UPI002788630A|nr:alpha/beta hydrolase [Variovorax boronicumulans]MDP9992863.1 acetyl esterase/lipase [Variovorax boronicumulans]MDQ0004046.1 acetyl esterase/lipase [Variovorax boronicumulans]
MRETKASVISRKLRRSCAVAIGLLAGVTLATSPRAAEDPANQVAPPNTSVYRNIAGRDLRVFEFPPADIAGSARPAILLVQGGAWSRGSPEQLFRSARYFSEKGFVSAVVEYRLADATSSPVESFSDVCYALAFLRKNAGRLGLAPSRVALWGISSSAQLVASAATVGCDSAEGSSGNGGPDALLLVSPVVDAVSDGLFRDLMKGHGKPSSLSPTHTLTRSIAPTLIMQGNADHTTPIERSKVFCERARGLGSRCELIVLEGQGHVLDRPTRDEVLDRQVRFLREMWQ